MNIAEVKQTMFDQGIPAEVIAQFNVPASEAGTPKEQIEFAEQMDRLLSKAQILSVMEEQGCNKNAPSAAFMQKMDGKSVAERLDVLNAMDITESAHGRINADGTLSIFWNFADNGKYFCVCPAIGELKEPTAVSLTYCGCCSGHVKFHFEHQLGVKLRLKETVSSPLSSNGEKYCEHLFTILA